MKTMATNASMLSTQMPAFHAFVRGLQSRSRATIRLGLLTALLMHLGGQSALGETSPSNEQGDWSPFEVVKRPSLPDAANYRNEVDRFVFAKLADHGWAPAPTADPESLLRRVYMDLIGLPPTYEDRQDFLRDPSAENLDRVVDDLLARPSHGERWARHWLDVARYADTNGYEQDSEKPYAWRYRDYVIASLNEDKPFDQFIREQLAGDLLEDETDETTIVATGFLRLGPWDSNPGNNADQAELDELDDVVSTTAQAFLALPMQCVRCHDQKDSGSLSQRDYYAFAGFFSALQRPLDDRNPYREAPTRAGPTEAVESYEQSEIEIAESVKEIQKLREAAKNRHLQSGASKLPQKAILAFQANTLKRDADQKSLVARYTDQLNREVDASLTPKESQLLAEYTRSIEERRQSMPELLLAYAPKPFSSVELLRIRRNGIPGDENELGEPVIPAIPDACPTTHSPLESRRALAEWIANAENPLTARVIVNRVWQHHFGQGLVRTPSDFTDPETPSHPELLDWLADWFVHDAKWSLKELHRLILKSNTYRSAVLQHPTLARGDGVGDDNIGADAWRLERSWHDIWWRDNHLGSDAIKEELRQNRLLWSFPRRRLDAEAIRDSVLAVSGRLNRRMYGPGFCPPIPKEILDSQRGYAATWRPSDDYEACRRSVYIYVKRSLAYPIFERLDVCDSSLSAASRNTTTTAVQALVLFNSDFIVEQSKYFADRLLRETTDNRAAVRRAYCLALCRLPTDAEEEAMLQYWNRETDAIARNKEVSTASAEDSRSQALARLCRVIFNLNEFVYTP